MTAASNERRNFTLVLYIRPWIKVKRLPLLLKTDSDGKSEAVGFYGVNGIRTCCPRSGLSTFLVAVENAAFEYCTNLTYIELGKSLKYVGPYAFYGNYQSLKMIVSKNPVPPTVGKNEVFSNYADATLYVPKGSVESYRNAPEWNKFLKIEEINPAGIDDITTSNSTSDAPCYDLQGRNIPYPLKGIYIQNGKKFIAK